MGNGNRKNVPEGRGVGWRMVEKGLVRKRMLGKGLVRGALRGFMIGVFAGVVAGLSGCGGGEEPEWKRVRLITINHPEGIAMGSLAKVILEDRMGLIVQLDIANVVTAYQSVAEGKSDIFPVSWQPVTDDAYVREYGSDIEDLGVVYAGARTGLVVPAYVPIDSITQLNQYREQFGGRIIGVEEHAGVMQITDSVIEAYGLDYTLGHSSGPAMASAIREAMADSLWVVATAWQPHWMFDRWEVKFLIDTLSLYGLTENIHVVAAKNVHGEKTQVAAFFERFRLDSVQMHSLMGMVADAEADTPEHEARAWMVLNLPAVNTWVSQGADEALPPPDTLGEEAADTAAAGQGAKSEG